MPIGDYAMTVTANTSVTIEVVAEMVRERRRLPSWNFRVQDGDVAGTRPDTFADLARLSTSNAGTAAQCRDSFGIQRRGAAIGTRASAPFAILDTLYQGVQMVRRRRAQHRIFRNWWSTGAATFRRHVLHDGNRAAHRADRPTSRPTPTSSTST